MTTQSLYDQLLHLLWCHCYEWKNLLAEEREARHQLEKEHRQQFTQLPILDRSAKAGLLFTNQLGELAQLRHARQQKRLSLKEAQTQQMGAIQQQLIQQGKGNLFTIFDQLPMSRRA